MNQLGFTICLHSMFRVGAAYGRDGMGAVVDYDTPLPADHLKGLMRAAARDVLHLTDERIGAVFGDPARQGPWSWSAARPVPPTADGAGGSATAESGTDHGWDFDIRHRVKVDRTTHSATKDHLVAAEQVWTPQARFTVTLRGILATEFVAEQAVVLRSAAAAVHGIGSWRRRGLGWVGIRPDEELTDHDLTALAALRTRAIDQGGRGG